MGSSPSFHHPATGHLNIVATIANYLTTLGRAPAVLHLTQRQWDTFRREAIRHASLDLTPAGDAAGDAALSYSFNGTRYVTPVEIVEIEPTACIKSYRAQYARENAPSVTTNTLSGATAHA